MSYGHEGIGSGFWTSKCLNESFKNETFVGMKVTGDLKLAE